MELFNIPRTSRWPNFLGDFWSVSGWSLKLLESLNEAIKDFIVSDFKEAFAFFQEAKFMSWHHQEALYIPRRTTSTIGRILSIQDQVVAEFKDDQNFPSSKDHIPRKLSLLIRFWRALIHGQILHWTHTLDFSCLKTIKVNYSSSCSLPNLT